MTRNQIIIVALSGLGLALAVFLALSLKNRPPLELPPPAHEPAANRTNPPAVPPTNTVQAVPSSVPANTNDPLLQALGQGGSMRAALQSMGVDFQMNASGNLLRLDLSGLPITDAGLARLNGQTQLKALYLFDTQVTGAGLKHLHGCTGLRLLQLTAAPVTDAGVAALEAALPQCVVVR